jgi:protein TonB
MKTSYNPQNNINVLSLDDIIFDGRNHAYGAFYLRKHYNQFLIVSFLFTASLAVGIFIFSFINRQTVPVVIPPDEQIITIIPTNIIDPPPLPPPVTLQVDQSIIHRVMAGPPLIVDNIPPDEPPIFTGPSNNGIPGDGPSVGDIPPYISGDLGRIPDDTDTITYRILTEPATHKDGDFRAWIAKNVHYQGLPAEIGIEGKVIVQFVVNKVGNVDNVKVLRSLDPALDAEVIRVVSASKWFPGKQNGHAAKQLFTIPIMFKLANN